MTTKITTTPSPLEVVDKINSIIDDKLDRTGNAASATTLSGLTATVTELNYVDGVTSNIQTQLNGKLSTSGKAASATKADTATTAGNVTGTVAIANGGTGATTAEQARINLGIGDTNILVNGVLPIEKGGTGADTALSACINLGIIELIQNLSQRPDWAKLLSDGSDGAFAPTANVTLAQGEYNYTSVNIPSGVTVTITKNVLIRCEGDFVNNGTINGAGTGGACGAGGVSDDLYGEGGEAGFTAGGTGGGGKQNASGTAGYIGGTGARLSNVDPYKVYTLYGGGGGGGNYSSYSRLSGAAGGNGGAGLAIVAKTITNNGSIILTGNNGSAASGFQSGGQGGGGGGGAGGSVFFVAESITSGSCTVTGGAGGSGYGNGSAGDDGRVYSYIVVGGAWN